MQSLIKDLLVSLWANWLRQQSKLLVVVVGCILSSLVVISQVTIFVKNEQMTLDVSWRISLATTYRQGDILGRDIYFTYGPLAQLIAHFATFFNVNNDPLSSYTLILLAIYFLSLCAFGLTMILIPSIDWKYTLFLMVSSIYFALILGPANLRPNLIIFSVVFLGRVMSSQTQIRRGLGTAGVGLVCFLCQLYSLDTGVFTVTICTGLLLLYSLLAKFNLVKNLLAARAYLFMLISLLGIVIIGNLVICFYFSLSSPNYKNFFDYLIYSYDSVSGYNYTMGYSWQFGWSVFAVFLVMLVYASIMVIRYVPRLEPRQGYLLSGLLLTTYALTKVMAVRSDGHVFVPFIPLILLVLLLGYDWFKVGKIKVIWAVILLIAACTTPFMAWGMPLYLSEMLEGKHPVVSKWSQIVTATANREELIPIGLAEATDPNKAILVYTYDNYLALALNRKLVAPVLQAYAAHTLGLQQKYIEGIARQKQNLEIIFGVNDMSSVPIDGTLDVTRLPLIFDYLYTNFGLKTNQAFGKGYLLLSALPTLRTDLLSTPLLFTTQESPNNEIFTAKLSQPAACSLIRITPKISYPPIISLLGRPATLLVKVWSKGQEISRNYMVTIVPGKEFSTYIPLIAPSDYQPLFGTAKVTSRTWDALQIQNRPLTLFDVTPSSIELSGMECINFDR